MSNYIPSRYLFKIEHQNILLYLNLNCVILDLTLGGYPKNKKKFRDVRQKKNKKRKVFKFN